MIKTTHLFHHYITWHYRAALVDILNLWGNFLYFVWHFFSLPTMFKTLFTPWRRIRERYKRGSFDLEDFFGAMVVNLIMRLLGAFIRILVIVLGLLVWLGVLLIGPMVLLFWLLLPLVIGLMFILGLGLLIIG